ncbi:hypothetical protein FC764_03790 [Clostridium botulinum]|nr:hypothetical protein [Clostridium botulinum]
MGVLFKNADITIYNRYYDNENAYDMYKRAIIEGVNWQSKRNATVSDKGVNVADSTLIFIDKLDNYVSPRRFAKLEDKSNYFTFAIGDKIVKGNIDFEVRKIADLDKNFDDVVTIMSVRELSNHWEVECK